MIEKLEYFKKAPEFLDSVLKFFFKSRNERTIKSIEKYVVEINDLEKEISSLSDEQLKEKTNYFKKQLEEGKTLEDILTEVFAVVREASIRTLGMRHYDVQLVGGILLHRGTVCEMMTGEGKTLVATCPAYLNALTGKGVHIITVNDYLAKRDSKWMGQVFEYLGLTVGCIHTEMDDPAEKRSNYHCDITYGTNNEFGFDYLRDNMKVSVDDLVQGDLNFCIIDEVDSILIDEARTPLIISGPVEDSDEKYIMCNNVAVKLKKGEDFTIDEKETSITLTDTGVSSCEKYLEIDNLYSGKHMDLPHYINNALRAHNLFSIDKDYVSQNNEIIIVDENTGRLMNGRRWSDGLHQAIEIKEGLKMKQESQTLASITFQNLFKLYSKISGMTGTALTESSEFLKIYKLDVIAVPPNRPCQRLDCPDFIFGTHKEKFESITKEVIERNKTGQPILIGTATIESSELVSLLLNRAKITHSVLNAKQHEREALIIAQAGVKGSVTVATNMAGRGTDIVLGGNIEELLKNEYGSELQNEGDLEKLIAEKQNEYDGYQEEIKSLGGLYVLGTERHDSRRIDNQLRGRSGRQGDPGESRFYLSLEDDLMRRFAPAWATKWMQRSGLSDGEPIEHSLLTKSISNAQKKVEEYNFEIRKNLIEYDEVMNEQRKFIYTLRNRILRGKDVSSILYKWVEDCISAKVDELMTNIQLEENSDDSINEFKEWFLRSFAEEIKSDKDVTEYKAQELTELLLSQFKSIYTIKENKLGEKNSRKLESFILLQTIDHHWKDHLYEMDHVKDSIGWRGYAQVDPKVEYKREAYRMFMDMLFAMKYRVSDMIVKMTIVTEEELEMESIYNEEMAKHSEAGSAVHNPGQLEDAQTDETVEITQPIVNQDNRVGRNDACPCGSGKKYKQCHGKI